MGTIESARFIYGLQLSQTYSCVFILITFVGPKSPGLAVLYSTRWYSIKALVQTFVLHIKIECLWIDHLLIWFSLL